ncbi:MAG: hypothetical protein HUU38_30910 [Anaerolineales bacterium]|nr:hypothetical protein [Anaerolineales bacterium]
MLFSPFLYGMVIVIILVTGGLYVNLVQKQACYVYARQKNLPHIEFLEFTGVTIATNQFHGHVCNFTDARTGNPVSLRFDDADVPYFTDTMQVLCMVCPSILFSIVATIILDELGVKLRQRRR